MSYNSLKEVCDQTTDHLYMLIDRMCQIVRHIPTRSDPNTSLVKSINILNHMINSVIRQTPVCFSHASYSLHGKTENGLCDLASEQKTYENMAIVGGYADLVSLQQNQVYNNANMYTCGEGILLTIQRPITDPKNLHNYMNRTERTCQVTSTIRLCALDVKPQKLPGSQKWRHYDSVSLISSDCLNQLVEMMEDILEGFYDHSINSEKAENMLYDFLNKIHKTQVPIKGVGALDGHDMDMLIFLNRESSFTKCSPPTGINVPLTAVKLGIMALNRAAVYWYYPSYIMLVGESGYTAMGTRRGLTGFSWSGTDEELMNLNADFSFVPEPLNLMHLYPHFSFMFTSMLTAECFFKRVRDRRSVGPLEKSQIIINRPPSMCKSTVSVATRTAYDALNVAVESYWASMVPTEMVTSMMCVICTMVNRNLVVPCPMGHTVCNICYNKLISMANSVNKPGTCSECRTALMKSPVRNTLMESIIQKLARAGKVLHLLADDDLVHKVTLEILVGSETDDNEEDED